MTRVQEIAKQLNKQGLKKYQVIRQNFEFVKVGNYEAKHLKFNGFNNVIIEPKNGTTCEQIVNALQNEKTEIKNGIVVVL